jgi:hypothetical protein
VWNIIHIAVFPLAAAGFLAYQPEAELQPANPEP